jgi:hypothetical protein
MYEEEQPEEEDIVSQLVPKIEVKPPHKQEFIPVKNTRKTKEKHTVERERPKAINKNVVYN